MRRFLLTVATAATALVGTACTDSTGIGRNVAGSYELVRINGQVLPVQLGSEIYEGGVLEIDSEGSFEEIIQYREIGDPLSAHYRFSGTWDYDGDDIRLEYNDSEDVFIAERRSGGRIVYRDSFGDEWEYQRF